MKLKKKLLTRFSLIATVSIILTAVFSTAAFWFVFSSQENTDLIICAQTTVNAYNVDKSSIKSNGYESNILRVSLISPQGEVLYDSEPNIEISSFENHSDRPEFVSALEKGSGQSKRMSDTLGKTTYYYAIKADDGNIVRVSCTIENYIQVFLRLMPSLVFMIIVVFIVCIAMSRRSTKRILIPIEKMYENPDKVPYDELIPLADTIKSQQKEIRSQIRKLQLEKDKINTLIKNMSEGFILIDMDKNVLMSNPSASKLIGAEDNEIEGTSLYAYSRNEVVMECVDSALKGESKSGDVTQVQFSTKVASGIVDGSSEDDGKLRYSVDGEWYNIDCTWDDPILSEVDETNDYYGKPEHIKWQWHIRFRDSFIGVSLDDFYKYCDKLTAAGFNGGFASDIIDGCSVISCDMIKGESLGAFMLYNQSTKTLEVIYTNDPKSITG